MKTCLVAFAACLILVGCDSDGGNRVSGGEAGQGAAGRTPVQYAAFEQGQPGGDADRDPDWDLEPRALARIPAGTSFGTRPPAGWSNIILFVEGRLASGDIEAASDTVRGYAKMFNLVILANAKRNRSNQYYLEKVAIGFSKKVNGKNTVITADTHERLGANLGFIGGSVLSGNEEALEDIKQTARYATNMIIDAPTIMLYKGEHRPMIVRYLVWVATANGRIGTAAWLLDPSDPDREYRVVEETFQYLRPNMREDRVMNVKADRFTFGIPSKDAFALVRIPQGTPYKFTTEMRKHAGTVRFAKAAYYDLMVATFRAMAPQNRPYR